MDGCIYKEIWANVNLNRVKSQNIYHKIIILVHHTPKSMLALRVVIMAISSSSMSKSEATFFST